MTVYYRPNLTKDQKDLLLSIIEAELSGLLFQSPEFDARYRLLVKLRDCRGIQTDKRVQPSSDSVKEGSSSASV